MKIAVVGCGQIADAHIQESRKIPGVEVVAVCDTNRHMAEQAAARFGIAAMYTSVATMLQETRPTVVHITTPPQTHMSIAEAVLKGGAHAYVEKPFTVNAREAEQLVDCAARNGLLVCVGHNYAFDPAFLRLKDICSEERLGDVVHVDAMMGYDLSGQFGSLMMREPNHWVHDLPGGVVQNNISHPLSMVLPFIPDANPQIRANGWRLRRERFGDARDQFFDEIRVSISGRETTAHLVFSCASRPVQLCTTVYGTKAQAMASIDGRTVRTTVGASMPGPFFKLQWARHDLKESRREYRNHVRNLLMARLHFFEGLKELLQRFYLAIEGRGELPVSMQEAVRTTAVMDEIFLQCAQSDPGQGAIA